MAASLIAAGIGAAGSMGASWLGGNAAKKQQQQAVNASQEAEGRYRADVTQGIDESQGFYDQGQNYLAPYQQMGGRSATLMEDITGINGPEAQQSALAMYRSNPSAEIMSGVRDQAIRSTMGSAAAGGLSGSGSTTTALARRLSDLELGDFNNWSTRAGGMAQMGLQAATGGASLAGQRAGSILGARSALGSAGAASAMTQGNAGIAATGAQAQGWGSALGSSSKALGDAYLKWANQPSIGQWQTTTARA